MDHGQLLLMGLQVLWSPNLTDENDLCLLEEHWRELCLIPPHRGSSFFELFVT